MCLVLIHGHVTRYKVFFDFTKGTSEKHFITNNTEEGRSRVLHDPMTERNGSNLPTCEFYVANKSIRYFQSRLQMLEPHFVEFGLTFNKTVKVTYNTDIFRGRRWYWTYSSPQGSPPYLSWNLDYGILSFSLLDGKTFEVRYVLLHPLNPPCAAHLGTKNTTIEIVKAFTELVNISEGAYHKYEDSYFCYLAKKPGCKNTVLYQLGLYLDFPVAYINYNCCQIKYYYENSSFTSLCFDTQIEKWSQCIILPFLMGLVVFLYFPILLFNFGAFITESKKSADNECDELITFTSESSNNDRLYISNENWVFLDGRPPFTLLDWFRFLLCKVDKKHPVIFSRILRFITLLLGPAIIYIQLYMYKDGMGVSRRNRITINELVKADTPLGFLSLLADTNQAARTFVPMFGGAARFLLMYYCLGLIVFVLPANFKELIETGISDNCNVTSNPRSRIQRTIPISPFCFSFPDITRMAMVEPPEDRGYKKGACLFKSSFYMLFTRLFWGAFWKIQIQRILSVFQTRSKIQLVFISLFTPMIIVFGIVESFFSIVYYAVPFFSFIFIMVKGAVLKLANSNTRHNNNKYGSIFQRPPLVAIGTTVIVALYLCFLYSICLIFVESFSFLSKIIMFCFVAVLLYPSLSFGYLFFFILLVYYLLRLFREFGDGYLELLATAIERSVELEYNENNVSVFDNQLIIANVGVHPIHSIKINSVTMDISATTLQTIQASLLKTGKLRQTRNAYGIPKNLFSFLVHKYRPMHIQFLKVLFRFGLIIMLIIVTLSITSKFVSGPTSELSEVMHVIFIVAVGALPKVLEVAIVNESKVVKKEIHHRNIEQSILQYWENESKSEDLY